MKKLIAVTIAAATMLIGSVAYASESVDDIKDIGTISVTIEEITAVSEQIGEYDKVIDMLSQLIYKEARGVKSTAQQAAVAWCVLNRFDAGYEPTIADVITAPSQFAYSRYAPTKDFHDLAQDVVMRWLLEQTGVEYTGRVLPKEYVNFANHGDGINWFRPSGTKRYWDWHLPDPYENKSKEVN